MPDIFSFVPEPTDEELDAIDQEPIDDEPLDSYSFDSNTTDVYTLLVPAGATFTFTVND